jgi:uncharacterized RDD family membrane protein YckC
MPEPTSYSEKRMLYPNQEKIDCFVSVITPENVEFEYALAGPFQRLPAFLFDVVVRYIFLAVLFMTLLFFSSFFAGFGQVAWLVTVLLVTFLVNWFYGAYLETRFNGQTFGKMVFKLRVISVDGRPINGVQAALRNLLRFADVYPTPLSGLLCTTMTDRFQRIGDLAAGTMVVVERPAATPFDIQPEDSRAFGLAELIPPTFVANYAMAQTIGLYVENRNRLPVVRRMEISSKLAGPLINKFGLLADTSPDLLLCAIYVKIFMSEQQQMAGRELMRQTMAKRLPPVPSSHRPNPVSASPIATIENTAIPGPAEQAIQVQTAQPAQVDLLTVDARVNAPLVDSPQKPEENN